MKLEIMKVDHDYLPEIDLVRSRSARFAKFNAGIGHIKGASIKVTLIEYKQV